MALKQENTNRFKVVNVTDRQEVVGDREGRTVEKESKSDRVISHIPEIASSSRVTISLGSSFSAIRELGCNNGDGFNGGRLR